MSITCIIPARFGSSRLPGKPLKDICGRPMIWWVYKQTSKVNELDEVIVATDNNSILDECNKYNIPCVLTKDHKTHINRLHEVSDMFHSDYYLCVCGDEPLIDPETIRAVLPKELSHNGPYVNVLMRELNEPTEVNDPGNIKIVTNDKNECVMLSRSPIPFPYKTILYKYKKIVGVECYNKEALDFFVSHEQGSIEKIEDVTLLRFLENHIIMNFNMTNTIALSVDTEKDLEKVRIIIADRISRGEISIDD